MGFIAPESFWYSALLSIIILFYLFKKQYEEQTISAGFLWDEVIREWQANKWWRKLQRNLLLLLQLLFLLLLIFALARPFLPSEKIAGNHISIVVDRSASMSAQSGENTRFIQMKKEILQLVDQLGEGQKMSLITADETPQLLLSKETDKGRIKKEVEDLQLSYGHENIDDALRFAQSIIGKDKGQVQLFSDHYTKEHIEEVSVHKDITVHNIGSGEPSNNISIQAFGVALVQSSVKGLASLKNETDSEVETSIALYYNETEIVQKEVTLPPQKTTTVSFNNLPEHPSYEAVINRKDMYALDNKAHAILQERSNSTYILGGEHNPFVEKVVMMIQPELVYASKKESGSYSFHEEEEAVYVLAGVPGEQWPDGPKIILSPEQGVPFNVQPKVDLTKRLQIVSDDEILQYVNVENVYLNKAYPIEGDASLTPVIKSGDYPIVSKGMQNGSPVVLFSFDVADSDWPLHPSFPILIQNALSYVTSEQNMLGYFTPNEKRSVSLSPSTERAFIHDKNGEKKGKVDLDLLFLESPALPGLYKLVERSDNGVKERPFIVSLPNEERSSETAQSFSITVEQQGSNRDDNKYFSEFWPWIALLAFILLLLEWEVYRRGTSSR
jgi:hypothetical protein